MRVLVIEKPWKCPYRRSEWNEDGQGVSLRCHHCENRNGPCLDDDTFPDRCPTKDPEELAAALWRLRTGF